MSTPKIIIMMATYNRADLIGEAIKSVQVQTYQNWELRVLDDGSRDDTAHVVASLAADDPRIQYLPAPTNLGIARNRNRGLENVDGEYIAVLDSDDLWHDPTKLEKQITFLVVNTAYALVGTGVKVIDDNGEKIGEIHPALRDADIRSVILQKNQFTHSSLVFRVRAEPFAYDDEVPIWEDYDLILRLGKQGKLANLAESMTSYRQHTGNITKKNRLKGALTHLAIIKKYKADYPNFTQALIKSYLRCLRALI